MRVRNLLSVALVAPLLVALSGCGGSPGAPVTVTVTAGPSLSSSSTAAGSGAASITPAASLSTACQLLTQKEAEAMVGTTLVAGQEGDPAQPSCTFNPDPEGTKTAQVSVYTEGAAQSFYDTDVRIKKKFTSVSGIGDKAAQEEDYIIFFTKNGILAAVGVLALDRSGAQERPLLEQAAKLIVSRLP